MSKNYEIYELFFPISVIAHMAYLGIQNLIFGVILLKGGRLLKNKNAHSEEF
jgi:hypothetical protein